MTIQKGIEKMLALYHMFYKETASTVQKTVDEFKQNSVFNVSNVLNYNVIKY